MEPNVVIEKELRPASGFLMLFLVILGFIVSTVAFVFGVVYLAKEVFVLGGILLGGSILGWILFGIMSAGFKIVRPNEAQIFTLFGVYYGTIKKAGFFYINPFCAAFNPTYNATKEASKQGINSMAAVSESKAVSLKKQTWDNERQKVNDILGNPIIIGAIVIWYVKNPTQAVFSVENYREYLSIQTDSTIRNIARLYPYDVINDAADDDCVKEKTLRSSAVEIAENMRAELQKRIDNAGLVVEEIRITHLAYAEEIAAAMLQRQQAEAIIAARQKIVDGAVSMVKMAIDKLCEGNIVSLDEERKAAMVSNLLVVLCGNRDAQPVINSGSIY
ncbi:MAG: SPFH domain-containing protein [Dehalococcoidia bacterium]|nr:SPFH domain-containing protein [Dehalococcoidia bacterium]